MNKRILAVFLAVFIIFAPSSSFAAEYVDIMSECEAKILQIVNGESMIVEITKSRETAMIKMIGVSADGSDTAVKFLTAELLGKTVVLMPDPKISSPEGRWSLVYIFDEYELFNRKIIVQGHAKINTLHSNATYYVALTDEATRAELESVGLWADDNTSVRDLSFAVTRVNINTASLSQLQTLLVGVDYYLAERIISYRQANPFRTVGEIKFVLGFTKEIFDKNRDVMTVSTNLADASRAELETLGSLSSSDIDYILDYRARNRIVNTTDIISIIQSTEKYDALKRYVDTQQITTLGSQEIVVNINTASLPQLMSAGLEYVPASMILDVRNANINRNPVTMGGTNTPYKRNYTFKTLGELTHFPGINFTIEQINALAGKLRLKTDINDAMHNELLSLYPYVMTLAHTVDIVANKRYSSTSDIMVYLSADIFTAIEKHIYVGSDAVDNRVNINTATREQLIAAGFTEDQAVKLAYLHKSMKSSWDIPFDLGEKDNITALYTNINKALYNELISLNDGMTPLIASDIILYRENQPIGSMEELRQIFVSRGAGNTYEYLKDFIVLR